MFDVAYLKSFNYRKPLIERLMSKIEVDENSGCWIFIGSKDRCGYGMIKIGRHNLGAHKVAYLMLVGDYDQSNLELMHTCDTPACINPKHLIPATHKENIADCISKGRHTSQIYRMQFGRKGRTKKEDCHNKKLTIEERHLIAFFTTRKIAIALGEKTYIGSQCKKHNIAIRKTNNGACVYCMEEYREGKTAKRRSMMKKAA